MGRKGKVVILGGTGMLGSMVSRIQPKRLDVEVISRGSGFNASLLPRFVYPINWRVINCVGIIKPRLNSISEALLVNSIFPETLPSGTVQIATDCVYSGSRGWYVETDPHDAEDVYGKSKSLGERDHLINLRCSIVGPEMGTGYSLLEWFLSQDGSVNGYTNHHWNGITTYHFAKLVLGLLNNGETCPELQHVIPSDSVTKAELLQGFSKHFNKKAQITQCEDPSIVDRRLWTLDVDRNVELWAMAGYSCPPTIDQMIYELAAFMQNPGVIS